MTTLPGYYTTAEATKALGMSRQNFYQSGLAAAMQSHKVGQPRLYAAREVGEWRYWLKVRAAWIAFRLVTGNEPNVPVGGRPPDGIDDYAADCPICDGLAIEHPAFDDDRVWCAEHGIVRSADYPPTARARALEELYKEDQAEMKHDD